MPCLPSTRSVTTPRPGAALGSGWYRFGMDASPTEVVRAAAVAAVVSGAPSTLHAVITGRSPLAAVRAAAALLPGRVPRSSVAELGTGLAVHAAISLGWTAVLAAALPR